MKTLTILPYIKGCYGQRVYIPVEKREIISLFDTISVWRQGDRTTEEGREILFELPFKMDIRNNPLIIYALNKNGLAVEGANNDFIQNIKDDNEFLADLQAEQKEQM